MAQPKITPAQIGQRARERADMVGSSFVSPTEERNFIESSWKEFWMQVVSRHEDIFLLRKTLTTIANSEVMELNDIQPFDLFKFKGVQYFDNSVPGFFLRKIDPREEMLITDGQSGKPTHYSLHSRAEELSLLLYPKPNAAYSLRVSYVPFRSLSDFTNSGTSFYFLAGYDEILVVSTAIKMKDKEESDVSVLMAEKAQLLDLMFKAMTPFDEGEPATVVQQQTPMLSIYADPFALEDYYGL